MILRILGRYIVVIIVQAFISICSGSWIGTNLLYCTGDPTVLPPHSYMYGHVVITATLFWPQKKSSQQFSHLMNHWSMAAPLRWQDFCGLLLPGLMGSRYTRMYCYIYVVPSDKQGRLPQSIVWLSSAAWASWSGALSSKVSIIVYRCLG